MFTICKRFNFSAGHALDHLSEGRQCARPHGHNYTVEVIMQARMLSSDSFVRDPIDYRRIELFIRRSLDRRDLNQVFAAEFEDDMKAHLTARARVPVIGSAITPDVFDTPPLPDDLEQALRTTTENIARAIFLRLRADFPEIVAVRVGDTPDTWAEYREDDERIEINGERLDLNALVRSLRRMALEQGGSAPLG